MDKNPCRNAIGFMGIPLCVNTVGSYSCVGVRYGLGLGLAQGQVLSGE